MNHQPEDIWASFGRDFWLGLAEGRGLLPLSFGSVERDSNNGSHGT
jgi:hypothetical protein